MWDLLKFSDNIAVIDEFGNELSYSELHNKSNELYSNIGKRTLIVCLCRNTVGSLLGYVTFLNKNVVPIMLSASLDKESLFKILDNYKPEYIWLPSDQLVDYTNFSHLCSKFDYSLLKTNYCQEVSLYLDLALLLTTSGSTGSPKFVRQSYKNILSNANSIVEYLGLTEDEKPITTLPMNYTYGLSIINSHIMVGATLLLSDRSLMQKEFWSFFKEKKASSFGGVPYTYEMLKRLRFMRMDLPSLRTMTQAGGKLSPELHKEFAEYAQQKNLKFIVMYGQSEATARMSYLPADKSLNKFGSMGIAIPGGEFSLVDENGNIIKEPNVTGELIYKGDNVTLGYAENISDLSKGDERNGILRTGDIAKFDADGFYYIEGRKKRFLKIYGNRVNLDEIDLLLKKEFPEFDSASTGVDDHMKIFITSEDHIEEVKEYISRKTGLNFIAFTVVYLEFIPKNDSGKVLYSKLLDY